MCGELPLLLLGRPGLHAPLAAVRAHSRLLRCAHAKVPFEHVGYEIVCAWLIAVVCTVQSIMPQLEEVKTVRLCR
jgi:hypothetical protein